MRETASRICCSNCCISSGSGACHSIVSPLTGCFQRQTRGMQRLARKAVQQLAQLRRAFLRALQIDAVADQRMADVCQVHADLVGAAGFQAAAQQGAAREIFPQPDNG